MSNQLFLAAVIGPTFLVMGLSVLLYAKVWGKIVVEWEKSHYSLIGIMVFNLVFGLVVINMYNVWEWNPYVLITLTGWIALLKAVLYFLLPGDYFKAVVKAVNCPCYFQASGAIMAVLGAWLSYLVYLA